MSNKYCKKKVTDWKNDKIFYRIYERKDKKILNQIDQE